jgi:aminoglycoside 3-N-acetyltransferase
VNDVEERMANDLDRLGVTPGAVLLVHSSLKSLGGLPDGPETAVRAIIQSIGDAGTLLMPALSYETVGRANPNFNVLSTASCVGALTEHFRKRPGTTRSVHPTHSVCGAGPGAERLLGTHSRDTTPCGANSPFHKLKHEDGQILFVGCGLEPNTSMHAIEELVEPPYLYDDPVEYTIIHADGRKGSMRVRSHGFHGWRQRYDRVEEVMSGEGIRRGNVLGAACFLLDAAVLWPTVHRVLESDPLFFVDRLESEDQPATR